MKKYLITGFCITGITMFGFFPGIPLSTQAAEQTTTIDEINFPDENLRTILKQPAYDQNQDGILSEKEIDDLTLLDCRSSHIKDLTGIDCFQNLTYLDCRFNDLSSLDVSGLPNLMILECNHNNLSSLDVSGLLNLTTLKCSYNNLSSLDVSGLPNLTSLECSDNRIPQLEISKLTKLESLDCSGNKLTELNVNRLWNLKYLHCGSNKLTNLDLTALYKLTDLSCHCNNLESLDLSRLKNLENLYCNVNPFTELDLTGLRKLKSLHCFQGKMTKLDLTDQVQLETLDISQSMIEVLDLSSCFNLTTLNCSYNVLNRLDLSPCPNLVTVDCSEGEITQLTYTPNPDHPSKLEKLECYMNGIKSLDISGLVNLQYLDCSENGISQLITSNNKQLSSLCCFENCLKKLDLSKCINLESLNCSNNELESLKLPKTALFTFLFCEYNNLKELDLTGLYNLRMLSCSYNQLISINITPEYSSLEKFSCKYNYRYVPVNSKKQFDLKRLKGFNPDCATNWKNGTVKDNILTFKYDSADYTYRAHPDSPKAVFSLRICDHIYPGDTPTARITVTKNNVKKVKCEQCLGTLKASGIKTPSISKIFNTSSGVKLQWESVSGAEKYRVFRKTGKESWKRLGDTKSKSFTDKTAKSGVKYVYTVRVINYEGTKYLSSYDKKGKSLIRLGQPKLKSLKHSGKNLVLKWGKVSGAASYRVYRKDGKGDWKRIATVKGTSCTDVYNDKTKLKKGVSYTYTVRALKNDTLSSYHKSGKKITY